ncbi:MAG: collagen-binding domain-containing protein [Planctomycetota bacterium]|jgi:hypothetical protein
MSIIRHSNRRRRGVAAVIVCVSLVALLGITALTVDLGYVYVSHGEMQAAVDAAALAGATAAPKGSSSAASRAQQTGHKNIVAGACVHPGELDITVGYWEAGSGTFSLPTGMEIAAPNAAHVLGGREGVGLFFAALLGTASTDISRDATAVYGGGRCAGIWGLEGIDGDGDLLTDSYDSKVGTYAAGNIYLNGDLCSNQDIVLEGGVSIGGDAMYGTGYSLTTFGTSYTIYGVTAEHHGQVDIPPFDMIHASMNNDNLSMGPTDRNRDPFGGTEWDFTVSGNDNLTLDSDDAVYYFTSVLISGQATIMITAKTTIYVSGPADFTGGGIINATQDPKNLIIYSSGPTMTVDGDAGFYGSIIAPKTDITFTGGSQIYGAVMGRFVQLLGNTAIHVDSDAVRELFAVGPAAPVLVE